MDDLGSLFSVGLTNFPASRILSSFCSAFRSWSMVQSGDVWSRAKFLTAVSNESQKDCQCRGFPENIGRFSFGSLHIVWDTVGTGYCVWRWKLSCGSIF